MRVEISIVPIAPDQITYRLRLIRLLFWLLLSIWILAFRFHGPAPIVFVASPIWVSLGGEMHAKASPSALPVDHGTFMVGLFADVAVNAGSCTFVPCSRLLALRCFCSDLTQLPLRSWSHYGHSGGCGCRKWIPGKRFQQSCCAGSAQHLPEGAILPLDAFGALLAPKWRARRDSNAGPSA
jgi:hypothetical protein